MKLTVVKIGGKVINEEHHLDEFLKKFAALEGDKILIHGGGNIASKLQEKLGITANMVEGRRVTDAATLEIVSMVFSGLNKKIVAKLQALNNDALGLSGADLNAIRSVKRPVKTVDYGFVGDVEKVNQAALSKLVSGGFTPVFCALTHDGKGQLLNTNADTIAAEIAKAMSKNYEVDLVYCFEQLGVLSDFENKVVIPEMDALEYENYKQDGIISDGMIPKLDNAFAAIHHGVERVKICHFDDLDKIQSEEYPGTTLCQS